MNYYEYIDEFDNPVEKTKNKFPYSYDGFILHRFGPNSEVDSTIYSDRFKLWDNEKFNLLKEKYFKNKGDYWPTSEPELIEKFLQEFFDKSDLKLIFIMEYCNISSGYPYWRFDFTLNLQK